jgi:hypothetical protein
MREDPEPLLERVGHFARDHIGGATPADAYAAERARARVLFEQTRKESWLSLRGPRYALVAMVAAAAVVALLVVSLRGRPQALTYSADPGARIDGDYLRVPDDGASASMHFSDGSEVRVGPGGEVRIAELRREGARVMLQDGAASVRVVHRDHTRWTIDAGPYVVEVTGTSFDLRWSTREETFELTMRDGSVMVRGPLIGNEFRLSAGQRLLARPWTGELRVDGPSGERTDVPTTGPSDAPGPAADPPQREPTRERATRNAPEPTHGEFVRLSWTNRVRAGDYAGVLTEAQAGGLESVLAQRSLADLAALSDAARYLGQAEVARRTLLAERERFAGSAEAKAAAFLLGRMSQDAGDSKAAIPWFTRYLNEAPDGPFAAEALGRNLLAVRKVNGIENAKPLAREYLSRFPNGAHAAVAREVAGAR